MSPTPHRFSKEIFLQSQRSFFLVFTSILSLFIVPSVFSDDVPAAQPDFVFSRPINKPFIKKLPSANAIRVRNINRINKYDFGKLKYVENVAIVFNGASLYAHPTHVKQNRTVVKKKCEYLLQIIDGNDNVLPENVPEECYFFLESPGLEFGVRSQDGRMADGSPVSLHLGSIRPEQFSPTELNFFAIWLSVTNGEPGVYPGKVRLVFKNGMEMKRNFIIVLR